ncbi:MAG TPA: NAD(P)H-hydrate epimerase [Candidatus Saccharimonadales bacterium]|nr:NAD(P)H-hydrate epimerase [Candidatus Saccharimonadales bacterium]
MREIDRVTIAEFHIELIQMMENAGRSLAQLAIQRFQPTHCTVLAGAGGNGGGGLVAARHLVNRGVDARVVLASEPERLTPAAAHQLDILRRMDVAVDDSPSSTGLVIDALIGYSLDGKPRGRTAELIRWANRQRSPVLSLDTPSGLDVTSGEALDPCIAATVTVTLALPKRGLLLRSSAVGELWIADISVPRLAYQRIGIDIPQLFTAESVIPLSRQTADDE